MVVIVYIVCKESDVFMASHGGRNLGDTIHGHKAYDKNQKLITQNIRHMLTFSLNTSMTETEFEKMIKTITQAISKTDRQTDLRISKAVRNVTKYPVPDP
ncbi:hypothetical protein F2Q70_00009728 [Brassica cretica]|uniref:Uncharacterized protein n=1 Tax=Brassica cretica TaxID=69181 RepID=A0A8S9LYQ0_BRACR|nr:hypothetical protein F2Q70_00009728 [Brassica cretica]